MPAITIFRNFTTRPFAGDDLQILCLILGTYRFIQLACLIPIIIIMSIVRFKGEDLLYNGFGRWCPQFALDPEDEFISIRYENRYLLTRPNYSYVFTTCASFYMVIDISWMFAIWSAASVGTPTQPKGRDKYLRPLIIFKMLFINLFPLVLLIMGIFKVVKNRANNFGCGQDAIGNDVELRYNPEATPVYVFFSILLITYALELFVFPMIITNRIVRWTRFHFVRDRYSAQRRGERFEICLGGCFKCISIICGCKDPNLGGKELKNKGELKDFASNLMEFANNDAKLDLVLSDMYVGGKLLARVQAERRLKAIQSLQETSNEMNSDKKRRLVVEEEEAVAAAAGVEESNVGFGFGEGVTFSEKLCKQQVAEEEEKAEVVAVEEEAAIDVANNFRDAFRKVGRRRSVLTFQALSDEGNDYVVVEKDVLSSDNKDDVDVLQNTTHYSIYAQHVYWHYQLVAVQHFALGEDETRFIPSNTTSSWSWDFIRDKFSLKSIGCDECQLMYAHFYSGLAATPYAILVDQVKETVVIAIRGTISIEDWVIDLQYVPSPLDQVGDICGFDGSNHHCHKGVLTRAKWLYNDIKKYRILKQLYSQGSPYKDNNLVVVGHSLGGGCAQVLSLMLRTSFPSLKCFAYEPPGCIFDDELCDKSKEWITSIVRGDDVVPRLTQPNLECLRDEFYDVLAQIKVPKINAFYDVRTPCPQSHLVTRNARILCPKAKIDRDTSFSQKLRAFRNERAEKNRESLKLYIAGKIIHLVDTTGDETKYVPYWASRYEFNQVVLSSKMLSDHSIPPLVTILQNLNLDEKHEVIVCQNMMEENKQEEFEEEEVRVFVCFSNPHGKTSILVLIFVFVGWILNIWSIQGCKFVYRESHITFPNGTAKPGFGLSAGIWAYNLRECIQPNECNFDDPENLQESVFCQPYPPQIEADKSTVAARTFCSLSNVTGFIAVGIVLFSTSMKLKKRSCIALFVMLIFCCLFGALQFLFLHGMLCKEMVLKGNLVSAACTLNENGNAAIATIVLWFVALLGSGAMLYTY